MSPCRHSQEHSAGVVEGIKDVLTDSEEACSERCFSGIQGHLQGLVSHLRECKLLRIRTPHVFNNHVRMVYAHRSFCGIRKM